jgi:two-component system OmpR family sensor kinase
MRPSRLAIRTRITGGSLLIAILISVVAGILIYSQVQRIVNDGQVAVLENIEAPYITALAAGGAEEVDPPGPAQLVAVVDAAGGSQIDTLPSELSARISELAARSGTRNVPVAGGSFLVRVTAVDTHDGEWKVISAVDDSVQASVLSQVAWLLIGSIAGINLAFGATSWLIGSAALSPVARLRRSAAELVEARSDELLPVGPAQDEIAELARTLNELIAELRASAERERQIVSDASHEFRTPLAILTTQLELAQKEGVSPEQLKADVTAAQRTLVRLTGLATSLLELSRLDARAGPGSATVGALADEVADCADRGRQRVGGRDISVDYSVETAGQDDRIVGVGADDFGRACDNLIGNSLAAMGDAGVIMIDFVADTTGVRLSVADDAGGMDEAFVPHAFERFSRADYARTGSGAGLGLPIVQGIVSGSGGTASLDNHPGFGLTVELFFPARA